MQSSDEPSAARQSHMVSDLISAVHVQGPLSHLPSHMQRQISHSPSPSQSPEGMGVMQIDGTGGVKGGFAGGVGFGVTPYADAEALSKLRGHPAWETQVFELSLMHYLIKNHVSNHVLNRVLKNKCLPQGGQVCTVLSSFLYNILFGRLMYVLPPNKCWTAPIWFDNIWQITCWMLPSCTKLLALMNDHSVMCAHSCLCYSTASIPFLL